MEKEYQYFVCRDRVDWEEGFLENIEIVEEQLFLKASELFEVVAEYPIQPLIRTGEKVTFQQIYLVDINTVYALDHFGTLWACDPKNKIVENIFSLPAYHWESPFEHMALMAEQDLIVLVDYIKNSIWLVDKKIGQLIRKLSIEAYTIIAVVSNEEGLFIMGERDSDQTVMMTYYRFDFGVFEAIDDAMAFKRQGSKRPILKRTDIDTLLIYDPNNGVTQLIDRSGAPIKSWALEPGLEDVMLDQEVLYGLASAADLQIKRFDGNNRVVFKRHNLHAHFRFVKDAFENRWILNEKTGLLWQVEKSVCYDSETVDSLSMGHYISKCFDSDKPDTVWHRYLLTFQLEENTRVKLLYYASNTNRFKLGDDEITVDDFLKEGSLSAFEKRKLLNEKGFLCGESVNVCDGLFHRAKGRYFWFVLELIGNEKCTPTVIDIDIQFDKDSYLRYLPAVYQQDEKSAEFLERFLSIFENKFLEIEEKIDTVASHFDLCLADSEALNGLCQWMGIEIDNSWSDEKIRVLLKECYDLYQRRGTRRSLQRWLEIYLGAVPYFIEDFEFDCFENRNEFLDLIERLYGRKPYQFFILVPRALLKDELVVTNVLNIISREKPAYTEGRLVVLDNQIILGKHNYLGVNTVVQNEFDVKIDQTLHLVNNLVVSDTFDVSRLGRYSKLNGESVLK